MMSLLLLLLSAFMRAPSDSVSERIVFSGCPSVVFVQSFVWTNLVTTVSRELLEQSG